MLNMAKAIRAIAMIALLQGFCGVTFAQNLVVLREDDGSTKFSFGLNIEGFAFYNYAQWTQSGANTDTNREFLWVSTYKPKVTNDGSNTVHFGAYGCYYVWPFTTTDYMDTVTFKTSAQFTDITQVRPRNGQNPPYERFAKTLIDGTSYENSPSAHATPTEITCSVSISSSVTRSDTVTHSTTASIETGTSVTASQALSLEGRMNVLSGKHSQSVSATSNFKTSKAWTDTYEKMFTGSSTTTTGITLTKKYSGPGEDSRIQPGTGIHLNLWSIGNPLEIHYKYYTDANGNGAADSPSQRDGVISGFTDISSMIEEVIYPLKPSNAGNP